MSISWEKDFDQTVLANKLSEVSLRVAQGSASFDDANLSVQIRAVIRSAVSFDEFDITEADQFRIVNSAVSTAASLNQLTPNGILAEISNQTKHFTSLPKKKYTLLTLYRHL